MPDPQRQLKIDLERRTYERLHVVICDTFDLYEMAGLEPSDAAMAIVDALMRNIAKLMATSGGDATVVGAAVTVMVQFERGEISARQFGERLRKLGTIAMGAE